MVNEGATVGLPGVFIGAGVEEEADLSFVEDGPVERYSKERLSGERFGDWCERVLWKETADQKLKVETGERKEEGAKLKS